MADELDKETQKLTNFAKKYKESMSETSDLATQMLQTFKDINGILDKNTKNIDKSRSFQKEILSDAKARGMIEEQINSNIMSAEKELMRMKLAQIDNSHFLNKLGKEYANVTEKITASENKLILSKKELSKIDNDILESEKTKSAILAKQQDVIEKIENRHRALQKVEGSILANNKAILDNKNKQASVSTQLKMIEEEMDAAQIKSTHEGMDLTDEYNSMMKKREYLKNKLVGLDSIENQYKKDGLNLGYRKHAIDTEILNAQDEIIEGNKELLPIDRSLVENREKQRIATKGILDLEGELNGMMEEKTKLEAQMLNPDEAIAAKIKELELQIAQNQEAAKLAKQQAGFLAYMEDTAASSGGLLGNLGGMLNKGKSITNAFKTIPGPFIVLKLLLEASLDRFEKLDKAAEDFRKQTGFSINQMVQLRSDVESVNRQFQDMGVGIEQAYTSAKALTDVFGRTSLITKETLGNVALLSANLGVAEADSANVLANFQGLGKATQEAAMNVIKVGAGISEKAGVPFKLVMNDIANASEQTTAMLGSNPSKLMKSAIAARALGTDMNKIVASQRKLLDYNTSINSELEASALLGRSISFQKARQLAYDGDIAGAAKATLDTVKKAGDFEKMSVYQREKLAEASGMELKDLSKMMAVEKQRDSILLGGDQAAIDKLLAQEAELENLKNMASLDDANLVKQNEKVLMQQKMQGMMSNFANTFQSLLVSLADILEPVVRVVAMILLPAFKIVSALIRGMLKPILNIGQALMGNADNTKKFAAFAEKVSAVMVTVYDWSEKIGEVIGEIFLALNRVTGIARLFGSNFDAVASTAKFISSLAKSITFNFGFLKTIFQSVAPIVEFIAAGFSRVYNLFKPLISMASNFFGVASKGASFVGPFVKVFGMIAKFAGPIGLIINAVQVVVDLVGQWMDIWSSDDMDIGEKILKSFVAIPKALYNVLVQPFIDMAAWLLNWMWPGVGDSMLKGIKSVGDAIFGVLKWPFQKMFGWFKNDSGIAGQSPSEIGLMIVDGIKAIGSMLLDVITFPFRTAFNFISGIFGGDGNLGTSIVDGIKSSFGAAFDFITSAFSFVVDSIKNAASEIFGFITSPFKKALDFVKNIPFIGKLFGGNDIAAESKPQIDSTTMETAGVIEVKNLDALREVVQQLTDAVANLGKSDNTETLTAGTKIDTSALEAKLDTLTNLLVGGAVRVYLDGSDVSAAMSATGR